jgi:cobalt transporter subunit CbtB
MDKMLAATSRASEAARSTSALVPAVLALLLGAFLIIGAGFAPITVAHNAAHDSRHSFAFPCH